MADRDGNSIVWFVAGLAIGAISGLLYAPRSGDETREALRSKAEEGRDFVKQRAKEARERAAGWADKGREAFSQQKEQFKSAYEAGRQAYHEATSSESGESQQP